MIITVSQYFFAYLIYYILHTFLKTNVLTTYKAKWHDLQVFNLMLVLLYGKRMMLLSSPFEASWKGYADLLKSLQQGPVSSESI